MLEILLVIKENLFEMVMFMIHYTMTICQQCRNIAHSSITTFTVHTKISTTKS